MRGSDEIPVHRADPSRIPALARARCPTARPTGRYARYASFAVGAMIALAIVSPARAQHLSDQDCREGSDFIRNAALSRDNGIARSEFTDRLDGDIATVMKMPVHSRWFVYGEAEASLLRNAVALVFNDPEPAGAHHSRFMLACQQLRAETAMKLVFESLPAPLEP